MHGELSLCEVQPALVLQRVHGRLLLRLVHGQLVPRRRRVHGRLLVRLVQGRLVRVAAAHSAAVGAQNLSLLFHASCLCPTCIWTGPHLALSCQVPGQRCARHA